MKSSVLSKGFLVGCLLIVSTTVAMAAVGENGVVYPDANPNDQCKAGVKTIVTEGGGSVTQFVDPNQPPVLSGVNELGQTISYPNPCQNGIYTPARSGVGEGQTTAAPAPLAPVAPQAPDAHAQTPATASDQSAALAASNSDLQILAGKVSAMDVSGGSSPQQISTVENSGLSQIAAARSVGDKNQFNSKLQSNYRALYHQAVGGKIQSAKSSASTMPSTKIPLIKAPSFMMSFKRK